MRLRLLAAAALLVAAAPALPCSAFLREGPGGPIVAKSYDWRDERGLVMVNKRGVAKRALVLSPRDRPAAWRSRYASVTFNQYGRELPNGGMNEAGLVVEVLILSSTRPERPDGRPVVTELGLVQYLLDQAATTDEAVALAARVRVAVAYAPIHWFVCDAGGACAVLELLRGRRVVSAGRELPFRAVTNDVYADSVRGIGRRADLSSQGRFSRIVSRLRAPADGAPVGGALAVLDAVRIDGYTRWNIVYEPKAHRVHFRTRTHPGLKTVALDRFPPGCAAPALVLDLAADAAGDVTEAFAPYTEEANRALVEATLAPLRASLPAGIVETVAAHPRTSSCAP